MFIGKIFESYNDLINSLKSFRLWLPLELCGSLSLLLNVIISIILTFIIILTHKVIEEVFKLFISISLKFLCTLIKLMAYIKVCNILTNWRNSHRSGCRSFTIYILCFLFYCIISVLSSFEISI